jgi:hypothetical protein
MNRRHPILWTSILGACVVAAAGTGCRRESSPPVEATPERPAAELSFEAIVEVVKDGIEMPGGDASAFVAQRTGATSRFQVHNTVTSQLIPPATTSDPYRGTITVTSRSIYSLRQSVEEDDKEEEAPVDDRFSLDDDAEESDSGFSSLDQDLVSESADDKKAGATELESVRRRADEDVRTYDLVYKDGRWELTSTFDPKTEKSVENAFKRALGLQP